MLLYLSYERNKKQWNKRIWMVGFICILAWLFVAFRIQPKESKSLASIMDYEMPADESGELRLLTYNIAGLPEIISSAKTQRDISITEIGEKLNVFDIVNVQEDFNYNKFLYEKNTHKYRSSNIGGVPFGDGLSTLSKYPITHFERVAWTDCNGADCLTPKGFSYAKIKIANALFIDIYNIHATAANDGNAAEARQKNLKQLMMFMKEKSASNPVIVMGDFNAHYTFELDNVKTFQEEINLMDAWVVLKEGGKYPSINKDFESSPMLEVHENCESIDKIMFRNSDKLVFTPEQYKIEKDYFSNQNGEDLSDHCAVSLLLNWKIVK